MKKLLLPLLLLLAACDGGGLVADSAVLDFQSEREQGTRAVVSPGFQAEEGGMTISGVVTTPCVATAIGGAIEGSGAEVELKLWSLGGCLTAIDYVRYTARITGLPQGTYTAKVTYDYRGDGGERQELGTARVRVR